MWICFERKIKHQIHVESPWKSIGKNRVRFSGPACVSKLNNKMIIGTVSKIGNSLLAKRSNKNQTTCNCEQIFLHKFLSDGKCIFIMVNKRLRNLIKKCGLNCGSCRI